MSVVEQRGESLACAAATPRIPELLSCAVCTRLIESGSSFTPYAPSVAAAEWESRGTKIEIVSPMRLAVVTQGGIKRPMPTHQLAHAETRFESTFVVQGTLPLSALRLVKLFPRLGALTFFSPLKTGCCFGFIYILIKLKRL